MAEPRIQYAQTADGVSIAYWTLGEGEPLVSLPEPSLSNIQFEWGMPKCRRYYERLASTRRLIRYDGRGTGLSERDVSDFSLDAMVGDLEAVVERLELKTVGLIAAFNAGAGAITYAVRYPELVSHLILWCSWERSYDPAWARAMDELAEKDWDVYTESAAHSIVGWSAVEEARRFAEFMRESVTPATFIASSRAADKFDVTTLLPLVKGSVLVLHRPHQPLGSVEAAKVLASKIPNARLAMLGGALPLPWMEMESVLTAIDEFLGEGEEAAAAPKVGEGLQTILFTDVEGSTALTQRLGDVKARELLREHERMVREALKSHGGAEVKTMGDGFMTSFSSATKALECAIAMQRAFAEHNESAEEPIRVRVGLNAGEPIAEDDPDGRGDLFGTAVNEAARITATAEGGEILVSDVVRQLAKGKDFLFADRGDVALKGFDEPVRLYEVRWQD
jgi:class 3 adenylate cyclase